MPLTPSSPRQRVVLIGASNLTRAISTVVESAQAIWGSPLDVCCAMGHGRSYGMTSNVLGRALPGILQCGLWRALEEREKLPTSALVTDIGNDLMYGAPAVHVASWVETVLDRLQSSGARVTMTRLPMPSVSELSEWRFEMVRRMLFPGRPSKLADLLAEANELDARLQQLAEARGMAIVEQSAAWYGFDPIHIRQRHWRHVWPTILASAQAAGENASYVARGSLARWLYLRTRTAERWHLFGRERSCPQPCGVLRDGTKVSFF